MRSNVTDYELRTPADLREALSLLQREHGVWQPFAGGTDLMVLLEAGNLPHRKYLNLWPLKELKGIEVEDDCISLGALTTYTEVLRHKTLAAEFPLLGRAASVTGSVATQNRGTLGGNIANASPAADTSPALLVYDAAIEVVSAKGSRWIPYCDFHTGYKQVDLQPEELICRIRLPRVSKPRRHYYRKVGTRNAQAISKVCFAGLAEVENGTVRDVRIAFGSVAPTVLRCVKTEAVVKGRKVDAGAIQEALAVLGEEISPIDDIRSTKQYRLRVAQNLLGDFLESLTSGRLL
jgi:CO/xanthine dehydrogenase FAD-binding subunit